MRTRWLFRRGAAGVRGRLLVLAALATAGVITAAVMLPVVGAQAASTSSSACTMVSTTKTTTFNTGTQSVHIENTLSTDLTATQHLVLRSLSGPSQFFSLTSLTSAKCDDNPNYPTGEDGSVNTFSADGTGSFGASYYSNSPGYSIHIEIGDWGDSGSTDNASADTVNFTITKTSTGAVVWKGKGKLTSGSEEISSGTVIVKGSTCAPSSSIGVLVSGKNVVAYVPKGNWDEQDTDTGVDAVNVEGSSITNSDIPTTDAVNSVASNGATGESVGATNGTAVYTFSGTTLTHTLTDGGSGTIGFTGGSPTTASVMMDPTNNQALLGLANGTDQGAFQFLNLSTNAFGSVFNSEAPDSPFGSSISENPLIDPVHNWILSANEGGNFEIVDISNPSSPRFYEDSVTSDELDSTAEDCSTGIALAPGEFTGDVFIANLSKATFTSGSPGTWTAPSQVQSLGETDESAGLSGSAVAQGTHIGVLSGEFGGNGITALQLPSTSGTGTPSISNYLTCGIPNTPDGNSWSQGDDPHTVSAYQSPNSGDAIGLFANEGATWLAVVDLTKMLNPSIVPRDTAGEACTAGTLPSSVVSFISLP